MKRAHLVSKGPHDVSLTVDGVDLVPAGLRMINFHMSDEDASATLSIKVAWPMIDAEVDNVVLKLTKKQKEVLNMMGWTKTSRTEMKEL